MEGKIKKEISSNTANDGSYDWVIPAIQSLGSDYRIRVQSKSNSLYRDNSDANFDIVKPGPTIVPPSNVQLYTQGKKIMRGTEPFTIRSIHITGTRFFKKGTSKSASNPDEAWFTEDTVKELKGYGVNTLMGSHIDLSVITNENGIIK